MARVKGPYANRSRYRDYQEILPPLRKLLNSAGVPITTYTIYANFAMQALKSWVTFGPEQSGIYIAGLVERYARSSRMKRELLRRVLEEVVGEEVNHKNSRAGT